jgi:uncharacterized surface protein with fasciclin (FAS1) repeats
MFQHRPLIASLACCLLVACQPGEREREGAVDTGEEAARAETTLGAAIAQSEDHAQLRDALGQAGLADTLEGPGPYTLFAPVDAAFAAIPADAREQLMSAAERQRLTALLSHHIVPGTVTAEDIANAVERGEGGRAEIQTLSGGNLMISRDGDAILIDDGAGGQARLVRADGIHTNGVLHAIDTVLMPETAEAGAE